MAGERILVVEDDAETRKVLVSLLTLGGYKAVSAEDGEAALLQVEAREPALILLDMVMPGMTGWTFLRRLNERGSTVPVIVLSGRYASPTPLGELSDRVAAYLSKPFDRAALLDTCARVLGGSSPTSQSDRRSAQRHALTVDVTLLGPDGQATAVGRVLNLSAHGMAIQVDPPPSPGERIDLAVSLPGRREALRVSAEVRWTAADVSGLNFVDLSDAARRRIDVYLAPRQ
jgi:CheY-like chemotaxis protein